jgi:ATP-dependent DNA ligase
MAVLPTFVEPMAALITATLPEGEPWVYELKFGGSRALALKRGESGAVAPAAIFLVDRI